MTDFKYDGELGAAERKQQEEALAGLLSLGSKKKPKISPNVSSDKTDGASWGLLDVFLDCYDKGNCDTNSLRWAFLSMIGTLKGRDCWVNFGGSPLHPNMYTALVGDAGCGKSTAIKIVRDMLEELGYPSRSPEIVDPNKLSMYFGTEYKASRTETLPMAEGGSVIHSAAKTNFLRSMQDDKVDHVLNLSIADRHSNQRFITKARLEELDHDALGIVSSELMGTIPPQAKWFVHKLLIDLYDAHDFERYEVAEGVVLNRPVMNLLGGITASGLADTFKVSDFSTGLLTRIMLVHARDVEKSDPFGQSEDYKDTTILLERLRKVYDFKGEVGISAEAKRTYRLITAASYNSVYDTRLTFYYNRRTLFLTKLAMIICLLHDRDTVSRSDMITANTLLLYTEFDMPKALTDFGNTPQVRIRNAIVEFLEKQKHKETLTTSEDITKAVVAKLGLRNPRGVIEEIRNLVQSKMVTALGTGAGDTEVRTYHLDKPKNKDVIEALKIGVADIDAIPEWNITAYALEEESDRLELGPDIEL